MGAPPKQDPTLRAVDAASNYNQWIVDRCRPYVRGRVIDVGGGIGSLSERVADLAEELVVAEPDPAFYDRLKERVGARGNVRVVAALAEELDAAALGGQFDAAVCFNVLEHIADDAGALEGMRDLIRPGGHLLLLVPAHPFLYGTVDEAVAHHRRYRKRDLPRLLEAAGFDVVEVRRVNPVGALAWLVWSRVLRRDTLPMGGMRAYDTLVPVLRALDRFELPVGLSLWAVGRRR